MRSLFRICAHLRLSAACLFSTLAFAGQAPQIASYDIDARLDPKAHAIQGHEVLTWLNDSPDQIGELQFHLYLNAFRDDKSTMLKEEPWLKDQLKERNGWGSVDVKRIAIKGGPDLTKAIRYLHPDDDNAGDRTVMAVSLPQPVTPGAIIRLEIDFYSKLPRPGQRAGWHGDYHLVSQWFPKIGVWEKAGERYATKGQWNTHQYHATSEFYSDFGRYAVNITVPSNYVVGATGGLPESRRDDAAAKSTTYRFVQEDVHDFAWTASPRFLRVQRTFDPAREVSAAEIVRLAKLHGVSESDLRLQPVEMILLVSPGHEAQVDRYLKAVSAGLKYFGLWYGKYPYRAITIVDPPYGGGFTGGMEYPTFITAGTSWLTSNAEQEPEMVTVHEFGHQYWYGMVANNEFEEAWLDEGFNTYSTSKILDLAYGPSVMPIHIQSIPVSWFPGLPTVTWDQLNRSEYLFSAKKDALARRAWEYYDGNSYGANSYPRTGIMLRTLENYIGADTMARIMRTYFQRWKFHHPTMHDYIHVANEVSGQDLNWYFDQFVYGSNVIDYAVGSVSSSKPDEKKNEWESVVKIRREGEAIIPVDIRIKLKNGERIDKHWDGQYRWVEYKFKKPAEVESVEVDPDHKLVLDTNYANNSWTAKDAHTPLFKWEANLVFWFQNLLLALASLA